MTPTAASLIVELPFVVLERGFGAIALYLNKCGTIAVMSGLWSPI
jgi:hypothetical protein